MNIVPTHSVEIALRTLGEEDRQQLAAWFDHLKNWKKDRTVQKLSKKLRSADNVYALKTTGDYVIFFRLELEQDRIVLLDIAHKETLAGFAPGSEPGKS